MKSILFIVLLSLAGNLSAEASNSQQYFQQGIEFEKQKKYAAATSEFVMAFAEDINLTKVYRELGNCAYGLKDDSTALRYYESYLRHYPQDTAIRSFYKRLWVKKEEATQAWLKGIKGDTAGVMMDAGVVLPKEKRSITQIKSSFAWEGSLREARKKAEVTGKPLLLAVMHNDKEPVPGARMVYQGDYGWSTRRILNDILDQPRYADWMVRNFTLAMTEDHQQCWDLVSKLGKKSKHRPLGSINRSLVLARPDLNNWRSSPGIENLDQTMIFLIETLRNFRDPLSLPLEEVTVCKLVPSQGFGVIAYVSYGKPRRENIYISEKKEGPFIQVNDLPVETSGLRVEGLRVGRKYFFARAPVDLEGNAGQQIPGGDSWQANDLP